jgi:hypothetical protein
MKEVIQWPWCHLSHGEARPFEMDRVTFFFFQFTGASKNDMMLTILYSFPPTLQEIDKK